jgi:hypothetical protein
MPKKLKIQKISRKRAITLAAVLIVLAVVTAGSTLAYFIVKTNSIKNTFTPSVIKVDLTYNSDVGLEGNYVKNVGDVPVYARVAIVATWENSSGQVHSTSPNVEVTLTEGWEKGSDGFYYLIAPLAADATSIPVKSVTYSSPAPTGYTLRVQVLASVIQSDPAEAVYSAWGFSVDSNGNLIINN